jgi:hypothetical protein
MRRAAVNVIPRRLAKAKPVGSLSGNLHALAIIVRACAVGSGRALVCTVGDAVHVISRHRGLGALIERKAPMATLGVYDQRASARDILADLQFAADALASEKGGTRCAA